jgi:hypothetical protein
MTKEARDVCEDLLIQLHLEMKAGRGEGDQADYLREEMEVPERSLSDEERKFLNNLSGDLYIVEGEDRYIIGSYPEETTRSELLDALNDSRWDEALELFRRLHELRLGDLQNIGRCYEELGFHKGAAEFFKFVVDPVNSGYVSIGVVTNHHVS